MISKTVSERIFNVLINDKLVEKNLNLAKQFGAERAITKKYEVLVVNGSGIIIDFSSVKGSTILNTLKVRKVL